MKTRAKFYLLPSLGIMIATILAVTGAKTDNKNLEITCIILGGIIAMVFIIISGEKQLYSELKQKTMGFMLKFNTSFDFRITTAYPYLETKILYNFLKDEIYIIKCLAEINFKTEYEIRAFIKNDVPDLYILNNNNDVLAIIRFTNLNNIDYRLWKNGLDDTPYLYDINGNFLGIIRKYKYIVDIKGIYKGELVTVLNHFYAIPYTKRNVIAHFNLMPNIIFTKNQVENFKNFLPDEHTKEILPEYKPQIILDTI